MGIPKLIWTYWNDPNKVPNVVKRCISNWKIVNGSEYNIYILSTENCKKFISSEFPQNFNTLTPQRQADWIRCAVLKEHGGIWLDASIILTESLNWLVNFTFNKEGFLYYNKSHTINSLYPIVENWFIASIPNGKFITAWFNEFDFATKSFGNNGMAYLDNIDLVYGKDTLASIVQNISSDFYKNYLTMHFCAQKLMQVDKISIDSMYIEDAFSGPFIGCTVSRWRSNNELYQILTQEPSTATTENFKLLKMIKSEREMLDNILNYNPKNIRKDSLTYKFLRLQKH